jgi:hypothetical protein
MFVGKIEHKVTAFETCIFCSYFLCLCFNSLRLVCWDDRMWFYLEMDFLIFFIEEREFYLIFFVWKYEMWFIVIPFFYIISIYHAYDFGFMLQNIEIAVKLQYSIMNFRGQLYCPLSWENGFGKVSRFSQFIENRLSNILMTQEQWKFMLLWYLKNEKLSHTKRKSNFFNKLFLHSFPIFIW